MPIDIGLNPRFIAEYIQWRRNQEQEVAQGKLSLRNMMLARIRYVETIKEWVVPEYWGLYDRGLSQVLAAYGASYLGIPSNFDPNRQRYWRMLLHLEMERLGGRRGLIVQTLRAAGQDLEAAAVEAMRGEPGEIDELYTRGHAATVEYVRERGSVSNTPIIVKEETRLEEEDHD